MSDICERYELSALATIGSRARGDNSEYSDLDLIGLGGEKRFQRFRSGSLVVELHVAQSVLVWSAEPSWWFALDELKIQLDDGTLSTLPSLVAEWRKAYSVPKEDARRNLEWLECFVRKLQGSTSDVTKAFLLATNTWEILAGMFMIRNMPVPASSHMNRLAPGILGKNRFEEFLLGDLGCRERTALELCIEIIGAHHKTLLSE